MKARAAIGYVIYARRHDLDMTATELAKKTGVSNAFISEVEHGKKEPSSEYIEILAQGVGMSVGEVLIEAGRLMREWEGYLTPAESERRVEV